MQTQGHNKVLCANTADIDDSRMRITRKEVHDLTGNDCSDLLDFFFGLWIPLYVTMQRVF